MKIIIYVNKSMLHNLNAALSGGEVTFEKPIKAFANGVGDPFVKVIITYDQLAYLTDNDLLTLY